MLSVDAAAAVLAVHPQTVRAMIKRGDLAAVRVARHWRISERTLNELTGAPNRRYANLKPSPIFPPDLSRPSDARQVSDADRRARLARLRGSVKGRGPTVDEFLEERQAEARAEAGL